MDPTWDAQYTVTTTAFLRDQPGDKAMETPLIPMVVRKQVVPAGQPEVARFQGLHHNKLNRLDRTELKTPDLITLHLPLIPLRQVHRGVVTAVVIQVVEWAVPVAADQQEVVDNF